MKKHLIVLVLLISIACMTACSAKKTNKSANDISDDTAKQSVTVTSEASTDKIKPSVSYDIDVKNAEGKLTGDDVFVYSDEWMLPCGSIWLARKDGDKTKELPIAYEITEKAGEEYDNAFNNVNQYYRLLYQYYKAVGAALPDMQKITEAELLSILKQVEFKDDIMKRVASDSFEWDEDYISFDNCVSHYVAIEDRDAALKVFATIQKIQYFPDGINPQRHVCFFWPDTDSLESVREELCYDYDFMTLVRYRYSDNGTLISTECLYSYPYELEKAAIEKYGCSKEREKRRLFDVYEKIEYNYNIAPPDTDEKLVGEQVIVPEEKRPVFVSGKAAKKVDELDKKAKENGYQSGAFEYQINVAYGNAYPNMRKITADEVREIFEKAAQKGLPELDYSDMDYNDIHTFGGWMAENIIAEIKKIQYYPDAQNTVDSAYLYWPDADTVDERRQEIRIYTSLGKARLLNYDEEGNRINSEIIYDLIDNR